MCSTHCKETSIQSVSKGGLRHVRWKMWSNFFVIWTFLAIPRVLERELGWAELDGMASLTLTPAVSARQSSCLLEHFANNFAYQHHGGTLKIWFSYKIPFICHIPDKNQSTGKKVTPVLRFGNQNGKVAKGLPYSLTLPFLIRFW